MPAKKSTGPNRRTTAKKGTTRTLSANHKKALAEGRTMSAIVDRYIVAATTPKRRGRKVSKAELQRRLEAARIRKIEASGVDRVIAAQEARDLQARISSPEGEVDLAPLEREFVKIAAKFSASRRISYTAWRDAGVSAAVLRKAKVPRTRVDA